MAIKFSYDKDRNILQAECDSALSVDDLREAFVVVMNSGEYPPDVSTLWDCRKLDFSSLDRGFEDQIIALRKLNPQRGGAKIAIVVSGKLAFGLSRMYELKSQDLQQKMMVFRNVEEARAWLQ